MWLECDISDAVKIKDYGKSHFEERSFSNFHFIIFLPSRNITYIEETVSRLDFMTISHTSLASRSLLLAGAISFFPL